MSVQIINGIGYGTKSGAVFFSELQQTTVEKNTTVTGPWAPWGSSNKMPIDMLGQIETCGILNSIIDSQARFALGEGVLWAYCRRDTNGKLIVEQLADIPEIDDFMEANDHYNQELGLMRDQKAFNNGVVRFGLNAGGTKIELFQRDDVTEMRYEQMNEQGISSYIYLCAEWDKISAVADPRILIVPLLNKINPLKDLQERGQTGTSFAFTFQYPSWAKKYYPAPNWYSAKKWVEIAIKVPEMKAALFANNFRPKYKVTIMEKFWEEQFNNSGNPSQDYTPEEKEAIKQKVFDDIDTNLAGNTNAYKTMFVDGWIDTEGKEHSYINIDPIEDPTVQGELLPDSAAANSEIAFANFYNPAIVGATMPSGPYTNSNGGSNVRESVSVQIIMHEPERKNIQRVYNMIMKYNKWDVSYKKEGLKLMPIIPATILTTLDTGAGTKPVMLGGAEPRTNQNQNPSNGAR